MISIPLIGFGLGAQFDQDTVQESSPFAPHTPAEIFEYPNSAY